LLSIQKPENWLLENQKINDKKSGIFEKFLIFVVNLKFGIALVK
jgi:hypothetical protein